MSQEKTKIPDVIFQPNPTNISENAEHKQPQQRPTRRRRLRGGMANKPDEDDKIDMDDMNLADDDGDDDDVGAPQKTKKDEKKKEKTIRLKIPEPIAEPTEEEPKVESKFQKWCSYIKIGFLSCIWIVIVIWLGWMPYEKLNGRLTTIFPNQTKSIEIKADLVKWDALGLRAYGAFLVSGDGASYDPGDNRRHMTTYLVRVTLNVANKGADAKDAIVSNKEHFLLSEASDLDHVSPVKVYGHFSLVNFTTEDIGSHVQLRLHIYTNYEKEVTIKYFFERSMDHVYGLILGGCVLIFLYISIVWELVNRTFVSVIAATLAIAVLGFMRSWPDLSKIIKWMDTETLLLLFGMMILVGILAESGIFDYFAVYAYKISKGHIWPMVNMLCFFTATISAFVDSVTMMLLITPIVVRLCEVMQADPVLVLMFLVIYANVGAASTPVGDPPNIIITTNTFIASHNVNFGNFMLHTLPCVLLTVMQTYIQIRLTFRKLGRVPYKADTQSEVRKGVHAWERAAAAIQPLSKDTFELRKVLMQRAERMRRRLRKIGARRQPTANYEETLAELRSNYGIRNKTLLIKSVIAFVLVMTLFFLHSVHGLHQLSLGEAALIGAILLLILADVRDMEAVLGRVEWSTLIFFGSLFVLMEALTEIGVIAVLGNMVENIVNSVSKEYRLFVAVELLLVVSALASAFLDNIPVTTMMIRIVIALSQNKELQLPLHPLVWALALGACFGGNGTLIGASANVVTAGVAEQHGYAFTFKRFFLVGFPIMVGNVVITSIYLYVCHVVFEWHDPPLK